MNIKGLDEHITAGQPESPDPTHWHVSRHRDDDDPFITTDFWSALDYAGTVIRDQAEFEYEGISDMGDAGNFEGAYSAFKRSNELDALYQKVKHAGDQHDKTDPDEDARYDATKHRAPLYQGYGGEEKVMELALRVVQQVNSDSPVGIWECTQELVYLTDSGEASDEDNGIPYHAADYYPPGRFTRGDEPAAMTDR